MDLTQIPKETDKVTLPFRSQKTAKINYDLSKVFPMKTLILSLSAPSIGISDLYGKYVVIWDVFHVFFSQQRGIFDKEKWNGPIGLMQQRKYISNMFEGQRYMS